MLDFFIFWPVDSVFPFFEGLSLAAFEAGDDGGEREGGKGEEKGLSSPFGLLLALLLALFRVPQLCQIPISSQLEKNNDSYTEKYHKMDFFLGL